jgi:hypothetical protein
LVYSVSNLLLDQRLIPDNPEDKSKRKFRYAGKIDALTYGWEIANEIVDVASTIVNAIPQKTVLSTKEEVAT